jgi:hypothetical protein
MFALFHRLRQRFGFAGQTTRSAARRPQVRLSLEMLDDRIVPTVASINPGGVLAMHSVAAQYASGLWQLNPQLTSVFNSPPVPDLTGTAQNMHHGSTINLGQGTLTVQQEYLNAITGALQFTGVFESDAPLVFPLGIQVSDDIGPLQVTGQIGRSPSSSGTGMFNGSMVNYYTNSISFSTSGDGKVGSLMLPDHQEVSFTGSILSVWVNGQAIPVGVSGSIDIKDTVTNIPNYGTKTFDTGWTPVPGTNWMGTNYASISYLT